MYPDDRTVSMFGEDVRWPCMGADGRFSNGDFGDPDEKPSMLPAETVNLILDNLERLVIKTGGQPNNISPGQIADAFSSGPEAKKAVARDENGRAKVAPRPPNVAPDENDIARHGEVRELENAVGARMNALEGRGGPVAAHDFGTAAPSQEALTRYACESVWGAGGVFLWNADSPRASTYAADGAAHSAGDIFNATWVRNTFAPDGTPVNRRIVLANTPDTEPPVFFWEDVGIDTVAFASNETAGIVKGGRSITADPLTGRIEAVSYGQMFGGGRNLKKVFGVNTVPEVMAVLRSKCNGEGVPDFWDLCIGDYVDIPSLVVDNAVYPNARVLVSGFNHYKNPAQEPENRNGKNHILFTFDKIVLNRRMNAGNTNAGGYPASELRVFLEGAAGDGTGLFAQGLKEAVGDYLYTVRKFASIKGNMAWGGYTVFPPTALEVGTTLYWDGGGIYPDDEDDTEGLQKRFPVYAVRRVRKLKIGQPPGFDSWWWLSSPYSGGSSSFCFVGSGGGATYYAASGAGGVAPAFCVA
jgi:hypothetical protein